MSPAAPARPSTWTASPSASTTAFKSEHTAFLKFIEGITEVADREWYASVMLNRLMFVYFIQKKGFLDGDRDYLRNRLRSVQERKGEDKFHSFYRYFLLRLFHEGLAQPKDQRKQDLEACSATFRISTAACSMFMTSKWADPDIQIADEAFERIFNFFDDYQWHLDDRPAASRQRDQSRRARLHLREVHQPEADGGLLHQGGHHRLHRQQHHHPVPVQRRREEMRDRLCYPDSLRSGGSLRDNPDRYIYAAVGHSIFCDARQKPPRPLATPMPLPPALRKESSTLRRTAGIARRPRNSPCPPKPGAK